MRSTRVREVNNRLNLNKFPGFHRNVDLLENKNRKFGFQESNKLRIMKMRNANLTSRIIIEVNFQPTTKFSIKKSPKAPVFL